MSFTMRTTKPSKGNKFYNTTSNSGWSKCVKGKPTDKDCDVLSNCVGYACGRFNEIIGSMKYPSLNCNAENFIERAKSLGLIVVSHPVLGGIMVWQKGSTLSGVDGAGHVAIVERIDSDTQIYTSESSYNDKAFYTKTRSNANGRWGSSVGYTFRGCIVNPAIGDVRFNKSYVKSYTTTANLNIRTGAGTDHKSLAVLPKGTTVKCRGYYNGGWLYVEVTYKNVKYTGFCYKKYLK